MNTTYKSLILISLPAIVSVAMEPVAAMIDTALVGHLNSEWLAAMAISASILTTTAWIFNFLVYTVTARVAQAVGAGDKSLIGGQIRLALLTAAGLGIGVTGIMIPLGSYLLTHFMGAEPHIIELALPYYNIRVFGIPFVLMATALIGILRGLQLIKTSLYQIALVTLVNGSLSYVLLYVFDLGVAGAAIGTTLSFVLGSLFGLFCLWRRRDELGLFEKGQKNWTEALSFGSEALNLFARTGFLTGSFFLATSIASRIGPNTVAAHAVTMQLWIFAGFLLDGFAVTATSFGGKLLGQTRGAVDKAKPMETWRTMNHRLLMLGLGVGILFSLTYWVGQPYLLSLFTTDGQLLAVIGTYYFVVILAQPLNGLVFVYDGILFGSRDFRFLKFSMMAAVVLGALPAFYLAHAKGSPLYIFLGFLFTNVIRAGTACWFINTKYKPAA
jgi:putative MATE family efflux protein